MNRALLPTITGILSALLLVARTPTAPAAQAQKKANHDPDAAELVFSDIDLFSCQVGPEGLTKRQVI